MKIFLAVIISCIVYSVLNHHLMGVAYSGLDGFQSALRSFVIYSSMFLIYSALPILVSILIAKVPKANRSKPYFPYFKVALTVTWVLATIGLYFGWYAIQATNS